MTQRYFVESTIEQPEVELAGDEARHLAQVMRGRIGQTVVLFDGSGREFDARIVHIDRTHVSLAVEAEREVDRESAVKLTLAVALPKGDRQRWMIEKAVELGVQRLVPLQTRRGVAQPLSRSLERLRRIVIAASKQCGRNRLMEIAPPAEARGFFADAEQPDDCWIAHPGGAPLGSLVQPSPPRSFTCRVAVGPEGGWTDEELDAASAAGWERVDLGPRILRVETATLLLAAAFSLRDSAHPAS